MLCVHPTLSTFGASSGPVVEIFERAILAIDPFDIPLDMLTLRDPVIRGKTHAWFKRC